MNPKYTVSQLASYIKNLISRDFVLRSISVEGEVSNVKYHSSGHIYFTLKDASAALNAVMFAGNRGGLSCRLREGLHVIVSGQISSYEKNSSYQIYAREIKEAGIGDLYQEFLKRKSRLEAEGCFDASKKKKIPDYALRIGIVTAPTGAAIQDIIHISHRRNPFVQLILYPAYVQGELAADSIVKGIRTLDAMAPDIIIVGRGGGSLEDLWAFNEEIVVRAIMEAHTPIISAVGHETDTTLSDYAADLRAPTPSAAAELAVFDIREFNSNLNSLRQRLDASMSAKCREMQSLCVGKREKLERLSPGHRLLEMRLALERCRDRMSSAAENRLARERQTGIDSERRLTESFQNIFNRTKHQLSLYSAQLDGVSPLKKLSIGYSFAQSPEGRALTSVSDVEAGDMIDLFVTDGRIRAEVREKEYEQLGTK